MVQKKLNKGILNTLNLNLSHKFINLLMLNGKKNVAQKILLDTLTLIKAETKQHPMQILRIAIKNVAPIVEVRSIRKRRTYFSVPVPLRKSYRISLAIKWIIKHARSKKGTPIEVRLKDELLLAYKKQGASIKDKKKIYKQAGANRAFLFFRWF